jgi:hypothetical protein
VRLCRLCNERPVSPSRLREQDYRCSRCRHRTPAQQAAVRRWRRTPKGREVDAQVRQRRIFIGTRYHSLVKSAEEAERINAHIKAELSAFKQKQKHDAKDAGFGLAGTMSPSGSCEARNGRHC